MSIVKKFYDSEASGGEIDWYEQYNIIKNKFEKFKKEIEDNKRSEAVVYFEELINDYWLFDNYQQPMSGWHDKQLLLEVISKLKK